jgi:hypothetical protein
MDFAPSNDTSTTAHDVPDSYPVRAVAEWPQHQSWSDDDLEFDSDNDENENGNTSQSHQPTPSAIPTQPAPSASQPQPSSSPTTTPIPPSRFYSKVPKTTFRGQDTEIYISALQGEVAALRRENDEFGAHTIMAFNQVRSLKHRLNGKASRSKRRKLNTDSRWLNSEEGLAWCEREEAEVEAEAARKKARVDKRQAVEKEWQQQREQRDPNEPFVGALNTQKKPELQDVAYSLGLEIEGRVEDLKSRISAYFDEHEEQRTSTRYIGLFPQLVRQARQAAINYNTASPPSQPLHNATNTTMLQSNYQESHIFENHQLTIDAHIQHPNTQLNDLPYHTIPLNQTTHLPGPSNWPSGPLLPGYIAHIPSYYNINSYPS